MKHGPISLIAENVPVICIALRDSVYEKMISNIAEAKARKGRIIIVGTEGDKSLAGLGEHVFYIPKTLGIPVADAGRAAAATAGLPHRGPARQRRGPAAQPRQERHGRMKSLAADYAAGEVQEQRTEGESRTEEEG